MTDIIVSVRMPRSLAKELKIVSEKDHFLDVSELVRSIVRARWERNTAPQLYEVQKLRKDIAGEIRKRSERKVQQEVRSELEKIKKQLREGAQ